MSSINKKTGCVTELKSDMHEKYDVKRVPYQNLPHTHPIRIAWYKYSENTNKTRDEQNVLWSKQGKNEVASDDFLSKLGTGMRLSDKELGREFALSYGKLVRKTALHYNESSFSKGGDELNDAIRKACGLSDDVEITDTHRVTAFVMVSKKRLFQNLIWVVGMDNMTLVESMNSVLEIVDMFVKDVISEVPHAKSGGGKSVSKAKVLEERDIQLQSESDAYVRRISTLSNSDDIASLPYPAGVGMDMLARSYHSIRQKLAENSEAELIQNLDNWAIPYKTMFKNIVNK